MIDELEAALVAAARAGSGAAFSTLVDRHQQALRGFLRRVVSDADEADDIAQETFLAAWSGLRSWRGDSSVRTWLCGIAWRKARSARRTLMRALVRDRGYVDREALERLNGPDADDRLALATALAGLAPDQRAAAALCLAQGFSHGEAAEVLGLPLGTVKSHVARARVRLLSVLGERS